MDIAANSKNKRKHVAKFVRVGHFEDQNSKYKWSDVRTQNGQTKV